ncbi:hypothetical protein AAMO2058_001615900 [Amorphochlora amoebiformis]
MADKYDKKGYKKWALRSVAGLGLIAVALAGVNYAKLDSSPDKAGTRVDINDVVLTVFPTSVDNKRHAERMGSILKTYGKSPKFQYKVGGKVIKEWRIWVRFTDKHGDTMAGDSSPVPPLPPHAAIWKLKEKRHTAQFTEALELAFKEQHIRGRSHEKLWIVKLDTITFPLMENLLYYIKDFDAKYHHFLGRRLRINKDLIFLSGGAGFIVSGAAAKHYVEYYPSFYEERLKDDSWMMGARDVGVTTTFVKSGIQPNSTTDQQKRQRFHLYAPLKTVMGKVDQWVTDYSQKTGEPISKGKQCCSPYSVTFHYMEGPEMVALDGVMRDQEKWTKLKPSQRIELWPKDVGGYSEVPKGPAADQMWGLVLDHLRLATEIIRL